jgi:hypothetical protein
MERDQFSRVDIFVLSEHLKYTQVKRALYRIYTYTHTYLPQRGRGVQVSYSVVGFQQEDKLVVPSSFHKPSLR